MFLTVSSPLQSPDVSRRKLLQAPGAALPFPPLKVAFYGLEHISQTVMRKISKSIQQQPTVLILYRSSIQHLIQQRTKRIQKISQFGLNMNDSPSLANWKCCFSYKNMIIVALV